MKDVKEMKEMIERAKEEDSWSMAFRYAAKYFAETVVVIALALLISDCGGCINIDSWMR